MPISGHPPRADRPFGPRYCSACRPKPTERHPNPTPDHASCRYGYGCECWCLDGQAHNFPSPEDR